VHISAQQRIYTDLAPFLFENEELKAAAKDSYEAFAN
jgi:hypothetical protein